MRLTLLAPAMMLLGACSQIPAQQAGIDESRFRADIKELASDRYQGRQPTTQGETLTLAYLEKQFRAMGLEPGNGDSYLQPVPMVTYTTQPGTQLSLGGERLSLPHQAVINSFHDSSTILIRRIYLQ